MKTLLIALLASLNVISFNIRIGVCDDGDNSWDIRKPATIEMIGQEKPDILALQEAMQFQVSYIAENCPEYEVVGTSADNGWAKGKDMTFFYRKSQLQCIEWGTFWLSDTPLRPSKGWDGAYERTATWALMRSLSSGRCFIFVNTHLDHVGVQARQKGLELIMEQIAELNKGNLPVVLCGDFNCQIDAPEMDSIRNRMQNARTGARKTDAQASFNNWGKEASTIDFIFHTGFRRCRRFTTLTGTYAAKPFISDHYPIKAELDF